VYAPDLLGRPPAYECEIELPGGDSISFEEFDPAARACGASTERQTYVFGPAASVLATAAGLPADHAWVIRVCAALDRERAAPGYCGWRRTQLVVKPGAGHVLHVTAAANRDSIRRHGLDWSRMSAAAGIAGSQKPELPAVFVCDDRFGASFFLQMARAPSDVWEVRVDGLWLESGPSGWWIIPHPVGPDRLRLAEQDVPAGR